MQDYRRIRVCLAALCTIMIYEGANSLIGPGRERTPRVCEGPSGDVRDVHFKARDGAVEGDECVEFGLWVGAQRESGPFGSGDGGCGVERKPESGLG
jgi:hypothetical protein